MIERDSRPRILLVTRNLPPLLGGMEKLNQRLVEGLCAWADVVVIGPVGCSVAIPSARVREVPVRPLWRFLFGATALAMREAVRARPAIVIAGSGLTAPIVALAARMTGARSGVYLHGLDLIVENPVYRALWLPAIRGTNVAMTNSRNTRGLALANGLSGDRVRVINPGTDLTPAAAGARSRFRSRFGFADAPVLLSVGRLTARKGLAEFVARALPSIRARHPDVVLAVIGDEAPDALHRVGGGAAELLSVAEAAGVASAVRLLGACDDATLQDAYAGADLHVFPVRHMAGDVEGFGMVAIEAAAHGLATVAFDVGGVADAVTPDTGELVQAADHARFADAVLHWLDGYDRARCRQAAARFSWERFDAEVRAMLEPQCAT